MRRGPCYCVPLLLFALSACGSAAPIQPIPTLDPLAAQGKHLFNQNCATCHALLPDTIIVGPSLAGVAARAGSRKPGYDAKQYIEESILHLHRDGDVRHARGDAGCELVTVAV